VKPEKPECELTTLDAVLKEEQRELLRHLDHVYATPDSKEGDWSAFLDRFPDALTGFYREPIAHLDRERYIDGWEHRVDVLVKRELSYGFDVLELKSGVDVMDTSGKLASAAQDAFKQVMLYAGTLRRSENRTRLALKGFDLTEQPQVDILGFKNRSNRSSGDIDKAIHEFVLSQWPNARIPRLMTWDDLKSEISNSALELLTARLQFRRWIHRALRKTARLPDAVSAWSSVSAQIGWRQVGAVLSSFLTGAIGCHRHSTCCPGELTCVPTYAQFSRMR
jgi:hypothetical protein